MAGGGDEALHVRALDRETVEIGRFGVRCRLRYSLLIAGEHLRATSTVVDTTPAGEAEGFAAGEAQVTAHFITATVTDTIRASEHGIEVLRRWSIIPALPVAMLFTFEVDGASLGAEGLHFVAPGCCAGDISPRTRCGVSTDELASPVAAFHGVRWALAVASEGGGERESLSIRGRRGDPATPAGAPLATLDFRLPAALEPLRPDDETESDGDDWLAPQAGRAVERRYHVTVAPAGRLWHLLAARHRRPDAGGQRRPPRPAFVQHLDDALDGLLTTHLVEEGAVFGLRAQHPGDGEPASIDASGAEWLSASASAAAGAALLASGGAEREERARRLIDFALRGQHPSGLFFERYDYQRRRWRGLDRRAKPPRLALVDAVRTSRALRHALTALGDDPAAGRLRLAWQRFAEWFLRKGNPGAIGAVLTPGGGVIEEGMDALLLVTEWLALAASGYRPAGVRRADTLPTAARELLLSQGGDASVEGRLPSTRRSEPSGVAALLVVEALLSLSQSGTEAVAWDDGPGHAAAANLLAWMGTDHHGLGGNGGLADSLHRRRWLTIGNRVAHALMGLSAAAGGSGAAVYRTAAAAAIGFALRFPVGTAYVVGPTLAAGPIDSRVVADEVHYGRALLRSHAQLFSR